MSTNGDETEFDGMLDGTDIDGETIVIDDYEEDDDADDDIEPLDDDDDYDDSLDDLEYDDATDEEIDFVVALYREDGEPQASDLASPLANDLDALISALRRLPADAGAIGLVSIGGEFFVIVRVRGKMVQVMLNDSVAAGDWPIARDVVDFLGLDVPAEDEDSEIVGDTAILADTGVSEFDLETIAGDYDEDSGDLVRQIVDLLKMRTQFEAAVADR